MIKTFHAKKKVQILVMGKKISMKNLTITNCKIYLSRKRKPFLLRNACNISNKYVRNLDFAHQPNLRS